MHPSKWTMAAGESSWTRPSRTLCSAIVRAHRWTLCSSILVPAESRPAVMEVMRVLAPGDVADDRDDDQEEVSDDGPHASTAVVTVPWK